MLAAPQAFRTATSFLRLFPNACKRGVAFRFCPSINLKTGNITAEYVVVSEFPLVSRVCALLGHCVASMFSMNLLLRTSSSILLLLRAPRSIRSSQVRLIMPCPTEHLHSRPAYGCVALLPLQDSSSSSTHSRSTCPCPSP